MKKAYLSNLLVGNVYLHNIHWNVVGDKFLAIHEFTEALYDEFFEMYDVVAERMKMDGDMPIANVKGYMDNATIKDLEDKEHTTEESFSLVKDLLVEMRRLAIDIRKEADEKDDFNWVGIMEDHIAFYDKNLWFLEAFLK